MRARSTSTSAATRGRDPGRSGGLCDRLLEDNDGRRHAHAPLLVLQGPLPIEIPCVLLRSLGLLLLNGCKHLTRGADRDGDARTGPSLGGADNVGVGVLLRTSTTKTSPTGGGSAAGSAVATRAAGEIDSAARLETSSGAAAQAARKAEPMTGTTVSRFMALASSWCGNRATSKV